MASNLADVYCLHLWQSVWSALVVDLDHPDGRSSGAVSHERDANNDADFVSARESLKPQTENSRTRQGGAPPDIVGCLQVRIATQMGGAGKAIVYQTVIGLRGWLRCALIASHQQQQQLSKRDKETSRR